MFKRVVSFILYFLLCTVICTAVSLFSEEMTPTVQLTLIGNKSEMVEFGSEYSDSGCIARYGSSMLGYTDLEYTCSGSVDTKQLGTYSLEYVTTKGKTTVTATRIVNVVDTVSPIITCDDIIRVYEGTKVFPLQYTANDTVDGDLTAAVEREDLKSSVRLTVSDKSGNQTIKEVSVEFMKDTTPPQIVLNGLSKIYIRKDSAYSEPGYTASDNCDGNITNRVVVTGNIDTSRVGTQKISYTVADAAGNKTTAVREVGIYQIPTDTDNKSSSVIYLTFDDGPGKYTEQLLNTLKSYNVKATFFVTNQFPDYQSLIGRASREGHAIGAHTYSHTWDIYSSVDAYMADFNSINEIIFNQTGDYSRIFRFPGGSSNIVSAKYCKGIMTQLDTLMHTSGYLEFDWNVDSADTTLIRPSRIANQVISKLRKNRNNIVLLHDIKGYTVNAIPTIIKYGLANGYSFAAITEDTPRITLPIAN